MNDYTPTTEEVRESYATEFTIVDGKIIRAFVAGNPNDLAEFDRWLEQHDAEVAKATEERIIKLLEDFLQSDKTHFSLNEARNLMALIRGEK